MHRPASNKQEVDPMKKARFLAGLAAAAVGVSLLAACGGAPSSATGASTASGAGSASASSAGASEGKRLKVYQISVMSGGAAWGQCEKGFQKACEELGWDGQYLAPQSANAYTEMVNLTETAITNGADIIMPCVADPDMFADVLQRAKDAGLTVVGLAVGDGGINCDAEIGTDPINLGKNAAEALVKAIPEGEEINVCTMQTALTATSQNDQRQAFEDRLKELRPDAKIISYEECDSSASKAVDKLSALYLTHPELNGVVSFDSYAGLGGAAFVEEKGLQGKFHVVGIDDAPEILRAIQAGTMDCTVAQMWYQIGYQSCYVAKDLYEGKELEYSQPIQTKVLFPADIDAWVEENGIDMSE